jgi:hypothetical protein
VSHIKTNTFSFSLTEDFREKNGMDHLAFAEKLNEKHKILVETTENERIKICMYRDASENEINI